MNQLIRQYSPTKSSDVYDNYHHHHHDHDNIDNHLDDDDDNHITNSHLDDAVKKQLDHIFNIETNSYCIIPEVRTFIFPSTHNLLIISSK